jgi:glycosyltransferase involved in cell wall biosynthesis
VRAYIACSDDIARHLRSIGLPGEKIVRIYNPMRFPERPNEATQRDGSVVFGITGQIIERKGHHIVIEAMSNLQKRIPDASFRLKIFGNGNDAYISRLKAQALSLGVAERIEWCGYRDNSDELYSELDCALVMTTNPDPCPLAAIEPGAYSLPAITSTAGGLAELVLDGKTGYQVPSNDVELLGDRMARMISDGANRRRMGVQAFWENKRRFDESKVIEQLATVLTNTATDSMPRSSHFS